MSVTIYKVAEKAGLSIATISRVINAPEKVRPETREKVISIMTEMGFTPKVEARERARRHLRRIGVITPHITEPSFVQRLRGITQTLNGAEFETVIFHVEGAKRADYFLHSAQLSNRLDGAILISQTISSETATLLQQQDFPVVFLEFGTPGFTSICIDNAKGGALAATHLINLGYRNTAVLVHHDLSDSVHPQLIRLENFNRVIQKQNLPEPQQIFVSMDLEEIQRELKPVLASSQRPQVIFATTDLLGIAVLKTARTLGIAVPEELGILGFDGSDAAYFTELTTVDQHLQESGKLAAEALVKAIKTPGGSHQTIYLPLQILERETLKRQEKQ